MFEEKRCCPKCESTWVYVHFPAVCTAEYDLAVGGVVHLFIDNREALGLVTLTSTAGCYTCMWEGVFGDMKKLSTAVRSKTWSCYGIG